MSSLPTMTGHHRRGRAGPKSANSGHGQRRAAGAHPPHRHGPARLAHHLCSKTSSEPTRRTHSGMPAIRKAWANLSISSALRNGVLFLIPEMRWVGSSCSASKHACRASSTRPDIAWHAIMIRCPGKKMGCCRTAVVAHDKASSLRPARK